MSLKVNLFAYFQIAPDTLNRVSAALACKRFEGTHSHDRVADMLADVYTEFDLDTQKVVGTVTDNGSNFVKAFKEFGIDSQSEGESALTSGINFTYFNLTFYCLIFK